MKRDYYLEYTLVLVMILSVLGCGHQNDNSTSNSKSVFTQSLGPSISGGGDAVVCYDKKGNIKSAELFDLYEGQVLNDYNYDAERASDLSLEAWIGVFKDRMGKMVYHEELQTTLEVIYLNTVNPTGHNFIKNSKIQEVNDESLVIVPPAGCSLVQLARYLSHSKVLIQKEIWDKLSVFDQASLIVHETFYIKDRLLNETKDSRYARYLTSTFVEEENDKDIGINLPKSDEMLICEGSTEPLDSNNGILNKNKNKLYKMGEIKGETIFYVKKVKGRDIGGSGPKTPDANFIEVNFVFFNGRVILKTMSSYVEDYLWEDIEGGFEFDRYYFNSKGIIFGPTGLLRVFYNEGRLGITPYGILTFSAREEDQIYPLVTKEDKIYYTCDPLN